MDCVSRSIELCDLSFILRSMSAIRSSDFCILSPDPMVCFSQPSTAWLACLIAASTLRGSTSRTMDSWSMRFESDLLYGLPAQLAVWDFFGTTIGQPNPSVVASAVLYYHELLSRRGCPCDLGPWRRGIDRK